MKLHKLIEKKSDHLVIFFAGWSTHYSQFNHLQFSDCDLIIVYDYTSLDIEFPSFDNYKKVSVIAWSFGVWMAQYCRKLLPSLFRTIAITGSLIPLDDNFGIPIKGFQLTVNSIEKIGISKFNRRMCGENHGIYPLSPRSIENVVAELKAIENHIANNTIELEKWDYAIIAKNDLIFPPQNLDNFWLNYANFAPIKQDFPHYIFNSCGINLVDSILNEE